MKWFICYCFILFLVSCNNDISIEGRIYKDIKTGKKTEINLKDYVNVRWDRAYMFQVPLSREEINEILGIDYNHFVEFTRPFVFIKDNKIVYYENLSTNIEKNKKGQLIYRGLLNLDKFIKIDYTHPNLKVKIEKEGDLEFVVIE